MVKVSPDGTLDATCAGGAGSIDLVATGIDANVQVLVAPDDSIVFASPGQVSRFTWAGEPIFFKGFSSVNPTGYTFSLSTALIKNDQILLAGYLPDWGQPGVVAFESSDGTPNQAFGEATGGSFATGIEL